MKNHLYVFAESITPPILFRAFKRTGLYRLIARFISRIEPTKTVVVSVVSGGALSGGKLLVPPSGSWQTQMLSGTYDAEMFKYLERLQLSDKIFFDVGAHIGYHSLCYAAMVGPSGKVFAFEPNPANASRARENFSLNPELAARITLMETALSDKEGETNLISSNDVEGGTSSGGFIENASPLWAKRDYIEKTGFTASNVTTSTIDALVASGRVRPPDVIKIDVEGAEQLVLAGAERIMKTVRPVIIVEFHSIFSTYECMRRLSESGYLCSLLKREDDGRVMVAAREAKTARADNT
jgi:FkbM family methyltransferase